MHNLHTKICKIHGSACILAISTYLDNAHVMAKCVPAMEERTISSKVAEVQAEWQAKTVKMGDPDWYIKYDKMVRSASGNQMGSWTEKLIW